jgi:hypothetical protein
MAAGTILSGFTIKVARHQEKWFGFHSSCRCARANSIANPTCTTITRPTCATTAFSHSAIGSEFDMFY